MHLSLFQACQRSDFLELKDHLANDISFSVGIDIATTIVKTALYIGQLEIWEDIGQMLSEATLGTIGAEEAQSDEGIAQMTPLPTCITTGFGVALLFCCERTPDVETAVMEDLVILLNSSCIAGKFGAEELG